jgi:hypothetical protein
MNEARREAGAYYALETLGNLKAGILALAETMAANRAALARHAEGGVTEKARGYYEMLRDGREKLVSHINESRLFLLEIGEDSLAAHAERLVSGLGTFNLMTKDYGALADALAAYAGKLPGHSAASAKTIGRCMNIVKMGHYPTDPVNLSHIMKAIAFPNGVTTNLLDPCCGEGKALKQIAVGNNCFAYGVELDESRALAAQNELHRVGFGTFFHSRISRDAFHLIFLNPPYLAVMSEGGGRIRDEKRFLVESMPHLMTEGLLIFIIPYYRLTPDICRILADNLSRVSVRRFTDPEFKKFNQVAVMGLRKERGACPEEAAALSELAYAPGNIPRVTEIKESLYVLPARGQKVALFKGAVFNERELARQLKNSTCFDDLIAAKSLSDAIRRPPLPFSVGQLGLIGGSGLLNGLIECDEPHIVKGRIVKTVRSESTPNHNKNGDLVSTEVTETTGNKMVFGILSRDGYRSLA